MSFTRKIEYQRGPRETWRNYHVIGNTMRYQLGIRSAVKYNRRHPTTKTLPAWGKFSVKGKGKRRVYRAYVRKSYMTKLALKNFAKYKKRTQRISSTLSDTLFLMKKQEMKKKK